LRRMEVKARWEKGASGQAGVCRIPGQGKEEAFAGWGRWCCRAPGEKVQRCKGQVSTSWARISRSSKGNRLHRF
jgi:hypothetical protein